MTNKTNEEMILELTKETYYNTLDSLIESMGKIIEKNQQVTAKQLLNMVKDSVEERKKINGYDT